MQKNSFSYEDLIACGKGNLFGEGNAKLPLPPMLMFDRITKIDNYSGEFKKGFIKAETVGYEDFIKYEGLEGCKKAGKIRLEGKDYLVKDGDILFFRFNT